MARTFDYRDAKMGTQNLLLSTVGPSFSGKTFSALRLATGIQRISGGDIALIDTENGRASHYADLFRFKHLPLSSPFDPESYLGALRFCSSKGAKIIIVDSGSHCWESEGGVLEWHERELDRMAGTDFKKRDRYNFAAWIKPKQAYTKLVNEMLQMRIHMIWCFRAKTKIEIKKGEDPKDLGFMSIAGKEMMYEFHLQALLYPGSGGVPTWKTDLPGERAMMKLPRQFEAIFRESKPLSEEHGEAMARWAAGDAVAPKAEPSTPPPTEEQLAELLAAISQADTEGAVKAVAAANRSYRWTMEQRALIKDAIDARIKNLREPPAPKDCDHPEGFAFEEGGDVKVCVHCGQVEPQEEKA